ncbi:efflux RND transporter permease subunit [Segnochrobactrum spirostomi]|uniref:MMPL family transporter n=1 Tax=Segnochrobactrum spirostomi TaxID=2608987 RepID=A0A6A7Y318_9HYPH|nr:efflux RND transporter permease subunit [Segnochrobactrum spirostomi]MQT13453.1 MMPL family transporter [Segnochrobactrum spirostomi]
MNIVAPFIRRPVATTLLSAAITLAGAVAFFLMPVAPLPQIDIPTIMVQASMAGASPETMATSVATPLERHLGSIAGVDEITSTSSVGSTRVVLQFDLSRDIDGAARDVQAAINAARQDLPASLKSNPTYRKVNPADAPILILSLTSNTLSVGDLYDSAATVLQQKLSQVEGVGQVTIGGSSLPAVRVNINPHALFKYGISLEDVRAALAAANANSPKGAIEIGDQRYQILANDQARKASQYRSLVIAYRDGAAVRLSDVADVEDSVEDLRNQGVSNGKASVILMVSRSPGANIIETVDRVRALLPELQASIPADIEMVVAMDRTSTIRASMREIERTLMISVGLVIVVVYAFLRDLRAAMIPSVAVPVSLIGTFGVMYLFDFSLDNFSLMAITVATGFVVDDAIVVLENVSRYVERGMPRLEAALVGAREVSFTVLSMSLSLVAVFLPMLLMGGMIGRLFWEFAVTLSATVLVSLFVSLTLTPMMCARFINPAAHATTRRENGFARASRRGFDALQAGYRRSLDWALARGPFMMLVLFVTIGLNVYLFAVVPKGFLPSEDTGLIMGGLQADQSTSFQSMRQKLDAFVSLLKSDPAVDNVVAYTGGQATNTGYAFIQLKPLDVRKISTDGVIARLRGKLKSVPGATMFLQSAGDMRAGGRQANAAYQYTLLSDDLAALRTWAPRLTEALEKSPVLADVNSDQQVKGLEIDIDVDRDSAARLGINMSQIDNTLYDAFGQRQVSTIYNPLNQYHVVMGLAPRFWQDPSTLDAIYVATSGSTSGTASTNTIDTTVPTTAAASASSTSSTSDAGTAAAVAEESAANQRTNQLANTTKSGASTGASVTTSARTMVPLSAFARFAPAEAPLSVNHQGQFAAATISFNLAPGRSLSDAVTAIDQAAAAIHLPTEVHGAFAGNAMIFQQSSGNQGLLILAALAAVYIVLGVLYESYVHPLTILSTLPSAGVGAVLALLITGTEFSVVALIAVFLLIGIVKKNAIMMIDFALTEERTHGRSPHAAIREACLMRFRPIMMTTMAALLGALPLALSFGEGGEMRRPLGIAIIGGLILSQALTLYTTPVVYLYLDRLGGRVRRLWSRKPSSRKPIPPARPSEVDA